jgi:hypothetical protein
VSASHSAPFCERGLETRRFVRQPMLVAARLILVTGERSVSIRDLSLGGARISGEDLPAVGTDVMLKRGDFECFGTIAWALDGQAGIAFDDMLDDDMIVAVQVPARPSEVRQPGFGRRQHSDARLSDGQGWIDG